MKDHVINIVHLIPSVGPKSFGLGPVALNLTVEQNATGNNSTIWSLDCEKDREWSIRQSGLKNENIISFKRSFPYAIGHSFELEKYARDESPTKPNIIHQHGIWTGISRVSNIIHKNFNTPIVITPHGSLQGWALNKSSFKKKISMMLYEKTNFHKASCFHAVAPAEISDIRNFGLVNPIAVIPNGISQSWINSCGSDFRFRQAFNISPNRRILLFLSRITPKKGLLMLLKSIKELDIIFSDWVLVIAGSDEFSHKKVVDEYIKLKDLETKVIFTGNLDGQLKRDAFSAAELFILPSYSEGAPIVILESLAAGVPVIATNASPWTDLIDYSCGWLTEITTDSITNALEDALSMNTTELITMGKRGKDLVSTKYTWKLAAERTETLYEWINGSREIPDFVTLE